MTLKLEVGKYYRTRDGRKVGAIKLRNSSVGYPYEATGLDCKGMYFGTSTFYRENGVADDGPDHDLIAEWDITTSPIRTVTRKEIVFGQYGPVEVEWCGLYGAAVVVSRVYGATEIRAAIATLTEIAEYLEENE